MIDLFKTNELSDERIAQAVYGLLEECIDINASDIHFNPRSDKTVDILFRVKGILIKKYSVSVDFYRYIEVFIKGKSEIPKQDKKNFDGRLEYFSSVKNKKYYFRVATSWSDTGNATKITLRLLNPYLNTITLEELGFEKEDLNNWRLMLNMAKGIIIVSGPTGSGKSTTLYASLRYVKKNRHVITIEDPIEASIDDITQLQVKPGYISFADHLKISLRHDPDVIMVGETRDKETAQIAISAALSGHLVLTTLHANSALVSVTRMIDLNVDLFNFVYSLRAISAQRLLPELCPYCIQQHEMDMNIVLTLKKLGVKDVTLPQHYYTSKGCSHCNYTGIVGKKLIYELAVFDEEDRKLIFKTIKRQEAYEEILLRHLKEKYGFKSMLDRALEKVGQGIVSINSVINYCL